MRLALGIIAILVSAEWVIAQPWDSTVDVPAEACEGLSDRDCLMLAKDLGITDSDCDHEAGLKATDSTTREECLAVNAKLRDIVRQHLAGTLPPAPVEAPNPWIEKNLDAMRQLGWSGRVSDVRCVKGPGGRNVCVALDPLDQPTK
jgi:hypothetical protein